VAIQKMTTDDLLHVIEKWPKTVYSLSDLPFFVSVAVDGTGFLLLSL